MVVVALTVDKATGELLAGPEIASRGFVYVRESEELLDEVKGAIRDALAQRDPSVPFDRELLGSLVKGSVRRFINQRFHRKPIVLPVVLEI
jgi:ribonuclease J